MSLIVYDNGFILNPTKDKAVDAESSIFMTLILKFSIKHHTVMSGDIYANIC